MLHTRRFVSCIEPDAGTKESLLPWLRERDVFLWELEIRDSDVEKRLQVFTEDVIKAKVTNIPFKPQGENLYTVCGMFVKRW